jgi:hypothetical protein
MQMNSQAEMGLAEIDQKIAVSDRNIREVGSLVPKLAMNGYPTAEIEKTLTLMCHVLHGLQSQRRIIAETLDGDFLPPRIAQPAKSTQRRANTHPAPVAASAGGWRAIYSRLARS